MSKKSTTKKRRAQSRRRSQKGNTTSGYPRVSICGAKLITTFGAGDFLLEQKGTVSRVSQNGYHALVRKIHWQVQPLPGLPDGYSKERETSALHAIVGLKEPWLKTSFQGYKIRDRTDDNKILLLDVVDEAQWKNSQECDLLHCRLRDLQECKHVVWAEENHLGISQGNRKSVNDPAFGDQWGLQAIQAPRAWASFNGSELRRTVVAIVDSGIDVRHSDLAPNLLPLSRIPIVHFSSFAQGALAQESKEAQVMDEEHSHGTFCAGVVGAAANNAKGIAGVHHKPALMPLKFIGPHKSGTVWDAAQAIRAAVAGKADVILAAWGMSTFSRCLYEACAHAREKSVLIVTVAGNLGQDIDQERYYPACFKLENGPFQRSDPAYICRCQKHRKQPVASGSEKDVFEGLDNVIVVGATVGFGFNGTDSCEPREEKTQSSSWGREVVDLGAPGYFIRTTRKNHNGRGGSRLGWASGTSMAAAFVAGALALVKTKFPRKPGHRWLKDQLLCTADHVHSLEPYWPHGRRLNLCRAVTEDHDLYRQSAGQQPGTASEEEQADFDVQLRVRATNGNGNGHGTKKAESSPPPEVIHGGNGHPGHAGGGHAH